MANEFSVIVVQLITTGVATFAAVSLWSMTREPAWMLVVIATIVAFGDGVFQFLDALGILVVDAVLVLNLPVFWIMLRGIPWLLVTVAFSMVMRQNRV